MPKIKILLFILLSSIGASAQLQRYDSFAATTATVSGIGNLTQVIPNATIQVFNYPGAGVNCALGGCTAATTYTSRTGLTTCVSGPLTRPTSTTCLSTADLQGNFGFWAAAGNYQYCVVTVATTQCYNAVLGVAVDGNTPFTAPSINNVIYLDGVKFAQTGAGLIAAVASLTAGQTLIIPPGFYDLGSSLPLTVSTANVTIQGTGRGTIIASNAAGTCGTSGNPTILVTGGGDRIQDLQMQGRAVNGTTDSAAFEVNSNSNIIQRVFFGGIDATHGWNRWVQLDTGATGNLIVDNDTSSTAIYGGTGATNCGYGIILIAANDNIIRNNKLYFTPLNGRHQIYLSQGSQGNQVLGNRLDSGTNVQLHMFALDSQGGDRNNAAIGNVLLNSNANPNGAIQLSNNAQNDVVANNVIIGVQAGNPTAYTITTCTEVSTTATCNTSANNNFISGQYVIIAGNSVGGYNSVSAVPWQITVTSGTQFTFTAGSSGLGTGNAGTATVTGQGSGIVLSDGGGATKLPSDNVVIGNKVSFVGQYGIDVLGSNNNLVEGNFVTSPSTAAPGTYDAIIVIGDGGSLTANANRIIGNYVRGSSANLGLRVSSATPVPVGTTIYNNSFDSLLIGDSGNPSYYGINDFGAGSGGGILVIKDMGTCTMAAGTCTAQSLSHTWSAAPQCFTTWTNTGALTGILRAPSTTTTVTPSSSVNTDTAQVNWFCASGTKP